MKSLLAGVGVLLMLAPLACAPAKKDSARPSGDKTDRQEHATPDANSHGPPADSSTTEADVTRLIAALGSAEAAERWQAARTLADIGPAAAPALPALVAVVTDAEPRVRGHAARALGMIQDKSARTIGGLAKLVADPDPLVRRAAIMAIGRLQPSAEVTTPLLIEALEDADPSVVIPALEILTEQGADAVSVLVEALKHKSGRYWASLALAEMGPQAKAAVPGLTALLKDDEPEVRVEAAMALGEIGPDAASAVTELAKSLADSTTAVRYAAAFSLGKIGDSSALPAIEQAEQDQDSFLRLLAAWALARLKPDDKQTVAKAVELIVAGVKQDDANVRRGAARALLELKAPPEVVGPALLPALEDADPIVQANVYEAFASLGQRAVPQLIAALDRPQARDHVLQVLRIMGPVANSSVPQLAQMLATVEDPSLRRELLFTLASIGPDSASAVETIARFLTDQDEDVRLAAGYALGKIGPPAAVAVDALRKNLDAPAHTLRLVSVWALLRIQPDNAEIVRLAVPELTSAVVEAESDLARTEAAAALGEVGAPARSARPALEKALSDESPTVRAAAAEALKQIGE
jgi:HEAT repeat protein